jgi:hypothetical protein
VGLTEEDMEKPQVSIQPHRRFVRIHFRILSDWNQSYLVGRCVYMAWNKHLKFTDGGAGNPCNSHLVSNSRASFVRQLRARQLELAKKVKEGCKDEGLVGLTFNTIGIRFLFCFAFTIHVNAQ